jgi:hypothetical protein
LQAVLHRTADYSKRKIAGQYATPPALAALLVQLTMDDTTAPFLDPFCGTGSIARAAFELKRENGQTPAQAMQGVWAGDKFAYPLQIAALALSEPQNRGEVLHVFQADAFNLVPSQIIDFQDPNSGAKVAAALPEFAHVACNLPFVPFEERETETPLDASTQALVRGAYPDAGLSHKSDLYAFVPFALWRLLQDDARLGVIISNAWLGANWGAAFRKLLLHFYHLETVIVSGKGRWFQNAQVVTNLLILRKRAAISAPAEHEATAFVTLHRALDELQGGVKLQARFCCATKRKTRFPCGSTPTAKSRALSRCSNGAHFLLI